MPKRCRLADMWAQQVLSFVYGSLKVNTNNQHKRNRQHLDTNQTLEPTNEPFIFGARTVFTSSILEKTLPLFNEAL